MAAVSQLIGHSGYNWSLRHLSPLFVAVVSVGEPVLASLLAWWILDESLDWRTGAGGLLVLAAIALRDARHAPRLTRNLPSCGGGCDAAASPGAPQGCRHRRAVRGCPP